MALTPEAQHVIDSLEAHLAAVKSAVALGSRDALEHAAEFAHYVHITLSDWGVGFRNKHNTNIVDGRVLEVDQPEFREVPGTRNRAFDPAALQKANINTATHDLDGNEYVTGADGVNRVSGVGLSRATELNAGQALDFLDREKTPAPDSAPGSVYERDAAGNAVLTQSNTAFQLNPQAQPELDQAAKDATARKQSEADLSK